MRAHQRGAALVVECAAHGRPDRRDRITLGGEQVLFVALAGAHDAGADAAPQQHPVVRRLPSAAGVERRAVEHDPGLGIAGEDGRVPFADAGVVEIEPIGHPVSLPLARRRRSDASSPHGQTSARQAHGAARR
jgi:hypothetical protein